MKNTENILVADLYKKITIYPDLHKKEIKL